MDPVYATRFPGDRLVRRKFRPNLLSFAVMPQDAVSANASSSVSSDGPYQIHTEARGPHWISWISLAGSDKPEHSIILIGKTREEAEVRARAWMTSIYKSH
jgi:hypothetical protein